MGSDGAIAVGVEPKQKALLEFNAFNVNNLAKWKLNKLLCYWLNEKLTTLNFFVDFDIS